MLGDPKRLRTSRGYGYLVGRKHRVRISGDLQATELVARLLADPQNVEALRSSLGAPAATEAELAAWLVTGLSGGALQLLKTKVEPPALDAPPETNLIELLPAHARPIVEPPKPVEPAETMVAFRLVDSDGAPLANRPFSLEVADGRTVEGRTDHDGMFEVDPVLAEGECVLRFTEFEEA